MRQKQGEFEQSAMPHSRSLLRFALRLTQDRAAAEDLVQETLLQAWRAFHQFEPGTNIRAWLFRILINRFNGQGRKARLSPVMTALDAGMASDRGRDRMEVVQALHRLAEEHRTVLMLAVVEGFTCREVSEILSVPIGTVMSRLSRARQSLREKLAPAYMEQGTK